MVGRPAPLAHDEQPPRARHAGERAHDARLVLALGEFPHRDKAWPRARGPQGAQAIALGAVDRDRVGAVRQHDELAGRETGETRAQGVGDALRVDEHARDAAAVDPALERPVLERVVGSAARDEGERARAPRGRDEEPHLLLQVRDRDVGVHLLEHGAQREDGARVEHAPERDGAHRQAALQGHARQLRALARDEAHDVAALDQQPRRAREPLFAAAEPAQARDQGDPHAASSPAIAFASAAVTSSTRTASRHA